MLANLLQQSTIKKCFQVLGSSLLCAGLMSPANAQVESEPTPNLPTFELGLGLSAIHLPDYPGAEQNTNYLLPFPYIIYRGEKLRAGRDGIRGLLFEHKYLELDISAGGSLPVNSDDNDAREGMDDLDLSFELGPSLRIKFFESDTHKLQLRLNTRALISTDFPDMKYEGWLFNPELRWTEQTSKRSLIGTSLQARYGSQGYHSFFHGVSSEFVTAEREEYRAERGFGGISAGVFGRWWLGKDWRLGAGFTYHDFSNATFEDGPLLKQGHGSYVNFSIAKIFYRSK